MYTHTHTHTHMFTFDASRSTRISTTSHPSKIACCSGAVGESSGNVSERKKVCSVETSSGCCEPMRRVSNEESWASGSTNSASPGAMSRSKSETSSYQGARLA